VSKRKIFLILVCCLGWAVCASAELTLHPLFTDHAVLQRNVEVPVWGWADPGTQVEVVLDGESKAAAAKDDGVWMVRMPAHNAGGPFTLVVKSGDETKSVNNIMFGEVWVASGQSNMQWTVQNSNKADEEIAQANHPGLRLFYVPRRTADTPQKTVEAVWQVCTPETIPGFSAVAYFFGRRIHQELGVPVGLIHTSWGGTPSEAWTSQETLESVPAFAPINARWETILKEYPEAKKEHDAKIKKWERDVKKAKQANKRVPSRPRDPLGPNHQHRPASLYNGMIAPLLPYAMQGAIWYQGESNAGRAYQYRTIFPAMITDWRTKWGQGDFPFIFVQLANFKDRKEQPDESDWAELREAQTMALELPNVGMGVTIDIGEAKDIHPRNKRDVGKRLAQWALAQTYGKDMTPSGPLYQSHNIKDRKVYITFDYADGIMAKDGKLEKEFAIAGEDKKFVWAEAKISKDGKVIVSSKKVKKPVAVRYGWADNPKCTLYNGAGLPASPFRTDDWPGITVENQ